MGSLALLFLYGDLCSSFFGNLALLPPWRPLLFLWNPGSSSSLNSPALLPSSEPRHSFLLGFFCPLGNPCYSSSLAALALLPSGTLTSLSSEGPWLFFLPEDPGFSSSWRTTDVFPPWQPWFFFIRVGLWLLLFNGNPSIFPPPGEPCFLLLLEDPGSCSSWGTLVPPGSWLFLWSFSFSWETRLFFIW